LITNWRESEMQGDIDFTLKRNGNSERYRFQFGKIEKFSAKLNSI